MLKNKNYNIIKIEKLCENKHKILIEGSEGYAKE